MAKRYGPKKKIVVIELETRGLVNSEIARVVKEKLSGLFDDMRPELGDGTPLVVEQAVVFEA